MPFRANFIALTAATVVLAMLGTDARGEVDASTARLGSDTNFTSSEIRSDNSSDTDASIPRDVDAGQQLTEEGASETKAFSETADSYGTIVPTYELAIRRTAGSIEISGNVPDTAARQAVLTAISRVFPELPRTGTLSEKPGAPIGFVDAAVRAVEFLALFADGNAQLNDRQVVFEGATFHEKARAELEASSQADWPDGFSAIATSVTAGPSGPTIDAGECEIALRELVGQRAIEFEAGRADIRPDSRSTIDRIAYITSGCPETLIAIAGHTDSDGTDETNYRLSLDRARTIVDLLVADGITPERFSAIGYGESRPLASNGSLEGKARNRRIEFVLRD